MPFQVVGQGFKPLMELWIDYCVQRSLTPEMLAPLKGELLSLDEAGKRLGVGLFAFKGFGAAGAYVYAYPNDPTHLEGRLLYNAPPEDAPRPGDIAKGMKPAKYYRPKSSANRIFVPPNLDLYQSEPYPLYICEGSLAAVYLAAQGYKVVAIPGVSAFRIGDKHTQVIPELEQLLRSQQVAKVVTLSDSDVGNAERNPNLYAANFKMQLEFTRIRGQRRDTVYVCPMPEPNDTKEAKKYGPDDYFRLVGRAEFDALIARGSQPFAESPFLKAEAKGINRFIWDEATQRFFDVETRKHADVQATNLILAHIGGRVIDVSGKGAKEGFYTTQNLIGAPGLRVARGTKRRPDNDDIYLEIDGQNYVNTFDPSKIVKPRKGDVSPFYKALDLLNVDSPSAVSKILTVLSHRVHFPARTPKYALLFTGEQGCGKSNMARLIGNALGTFSSAKADLRSQYTGTWRGFDVREWAEFDKDMDEEWLKDLVTGLTYDVNNKFGMKYEEDNFTLNIFTCNGLKSKIQEGDRRFVISGYGKPTDKVFGLSFESWVSGPGPAFLRYHLMNDVDPSGYDLLDVHTEMTDEVIASSKTFRATVADEIIDRLNQIEGLEIVPNRMMTLLLEEHRMSVISFNKEFGRMFRKPGREQVKINEYPERFRVFKNYDHWASDKPTTEEYRAQFDLAQQLLQKSKY